jgi:hypothetical protein
MTTNIPPWSYSSLTAYETCPKRYSLIRVYKKVKDEMGEAAFWGDKVHKALESRVLTKTPLPEGMQQWERIAAKFDKPKGRLFTETQMALTHNLQPCTWGAKDAWVRGIVDIGVDAGKVVVALDWKTGKVKPEMDQLKLFAGLIMQAKPYVEKVRTGYIWLAYNKLTRETYTRDDLPSIWEGFAARSNRLAEAYKTDMWPPRPSGLCSKWCPVTKAHCEFSGRE